MKTPQNWLESVDFDWDEQVSVRMIEAIQQDAFESGRVAGLREAALLIAHIDTYDGRKAHDTIHRVANKYQVRNATPNPLKSPSL